MARAPWAPENLYEASSRWVRDCLARDESLFTPGQPIWDLETVEEAAPALLDEDIRKLDYLTKLHDQTNGLSDRALQFTAELIYVHLLPIGNSGLKTKTDLVNSVLDWMDAPVAIPSELVEALDGGVANYGAGLAQRDRYVKYFAHFVNDWKHLSDSERASRLADPWAFRAFLYSLGGPALMQREAILHIAFPDTFEYAIAPNDKTRITKAFAGSPLTDGAANEDDALVRIRSAVEAQTGHALNLYGPGFAPLWREPDQHRWPEAIRWAIRLLESPELEAEEREYKLAIAERMVVARVAVEDRDSDWLVSLKAALGGPNNLTHWQWETGPFLRWCEADPEHAVTFLSALWSLDDETSDRFNAALELLPTEILSGAACVSLAALLLFGVDAHRFPPYRATVVANFRKLVGLGAAGITLEHRVYTPAELAALLGRDPKRVRDVLRELFPRDGDEHGLEWGVGVEQAEAVVERLAGGTAETSGDVYLGFLTLLDEVRIRMLAAGVETEDRLVVQGIVWWLVSQPAPDSWSPEEKAEFEAFRDPASTVVVVNTTTGGKMPTRAWLVRGANVDGVNVVPDWIAAGFVSIGWQELGDLPDGVTQAELLARIGETYPDDSPGSWRNAAGNVNRFVNLIRPTDLVLTVAGDALYIGRVEDNATFDPAGAPQTARRRNVTWLNPATPASRAAVAVSYPSLYSKLRTLLTVTDLREDLEAVRALAGLGGTPTNAPELKLKPVSPELASSLHVPQAWLQSEIIDLLAEKKQLIFYGPPGTGKTLVAQRIAQHLTHDGGEYELIQFHPSFSYEDFFEGFRPAQADGGAGLTYELTPGPLRRIAQAATADPAHPYVLIIDEINRGNIPKIFGELLFLLEYRDAQIPLQYSPTVQFGLPNNLFVIATMNTADRSIALVDAALRRRFYFVPFMPREAPVADVLSNWLNANELGDESAKLMVELNKRIAADEVAIGPSYFITQDGSEPKLERVWKHAIMPLLEEHYYGTGRDVESEFGLAALRQAIAASAVVDIQDGGEVETSEPGS